MKSEHPLSHMLEACRVQELFDQFYHKGVQKDSVLNIWIYHGIPSLGVSYDVFRERLEYDTRHAGLMTLLAQASAVCIYRSRYTRPLEQRLRRLSVYYRGISDVLDGALPDEVLARYPLPGIEVELLFRMATFYGEPAELSPAAEQTVYCPEK